jgi:hypothetical protein
VAINDPGKVRNKIFEEFDVATSSEQGGALLALFKTTFDRRRDRGWNFRGQKSTRLFSYFWGDEAEAGRVEGCSNRVWGVIH